MDDSDSVHTDEKESKPAKRGAAAGKSYAKAKKKRSQLSEQEKTERRQRHNQVEIRRRNRINQRFSELGEIIGCSSKQKRNILATAIDKLKECTDRVKQLQANIDSLSAQDTADASHDTSNPNQVSDGTDLVDHRSVFMHAGIALFVGGFDGRLIECNEKFAELFGFTRETILSNQVTIFSLTAPESLAVTFAFIGHLMRGSCRVELKNLMLGPQNQVFKAEITAWLIRENSKPKCFTATVVPDRGPRAPLLAPPAPSATRLPISFMSPPQSTPQPSSAPTSSSTTVATTASAANSWFLPSAQRSTSESSSQQQQQQQAAAAAAAAFPSLAGTGSSSLTNDVRRALGGGASAGTHAHSNNSNAHSLLQHDSLPTLPPVPPPSSSMGASPLSSSSTSLPSTPSPSLGLDKSSTLGGSLASTLASSLALSHPFAFAPQSQLSSAPPSNTPPPPFAFYPPPPPSSYQQQGPGAFSNSFLPFGGLEGMRMPPSNQYGFPPQSYPSAGPLHASPSPSSRMGDPHAQFFFPPSSTTSSF